jgi:hypothetical protein
VHSCNYTITMQSPAANLITEAHLHDGGLGQTGPILVDFFASGDKSISGNIISGSAAIPGRTYARLLGGTPGASALAGGTLPSVFYIDAHTAANPAGTARGQLVQISGDTVPDGLVYTTPNTYVTGAAITPNTPTSTGGQISNYAISPALSAGLSIHPTTGVISGTPTATRAQTDYTVTASNSAGFTTATVRITVNLGPPLTLSYTTPVSYVTTVQIQNNNPVSTGGQITSYTVSPPLPTGINLNPVNGVISGTPTVTATATDHTVTGSNTAGTVQATVNITVTSSVTPPSGLSYTIPASYPSGYAITNASPTVSGSTPMTFAVSPSLPAGLSINQNTGVISGTPTAVTASAQYTVTATNGGGSTPYSFNLAITLGLPGPLSYSNDPNLGYAVPPYAIQTMNPTHVGGGAVASYSVSPALPSGISLHTTTGVISGTPTTTNTSATNKYTITATNATGSTQVQVTINVPY